MSPHINPKKLIKYCQDHDIIVTAYRPLGKPVPAEKKPAFLFDDKLGEIAKKYNKTNAQIVIRYLVRSFPFLCFSISIFFFKKNLFSQMFSFVNTVY